MRRHAPRLLVLLLISLTAGCESIDPAPEDLDDLAHYLWSHYDEGLDRELAAATVNIHDAVDGDAVADPLEGTLSDLDDGELGALGMDADPADPVGLYLVDVVGCSLEQLVEIVVHPQQDVLYEDEFDAFDRTFDGDRQAFEDGETNRLDWSDEIQDGLVGNDYSKRVSGGVRRIPELDAESTPWGPALVGRAWLPEPAEFDGGSDYYWDQDYQFDLFVERSDGELLHLVALWRSVGMGATTSDHEMMQTMILSARKGWGEDTTQLCADDLPR